jgi:hypothetical protein
MLGKNGAKLFHFLTTSLLSLLFGKVFEIIDKTRYPLAGT